MVVAQLVEQVLPPQEIHGLNPDIGKILSTTCTIEKRKIKKKRPRIAVAVTFQKTKNCEQPKPNKANF